MRHRVACTKLRAHAARPIAIAIANSKARCGALVVAPVVALVLAACSSQAGGAGQAVVLVDQQFFAQCPFDLPPQSLTLVTDLPAWQKLVAQATVSPPPFEAAATQFDARSVLMLATRATATPRTRLLVHGDGISVDGAAGKLKLEVEVKDSPPPPGELAAAVLGTPCLVLWTSRVAGVKNLYARDAKTGAMLAQTKLP
jgi:hypothetical protein